MQKVKPLKETAYEFLAIIIGIFMIACMWFVVVLISYAMFLLVKEMS